MCLESFTEKKIMYQKIKTSNQMLTEFFLKIYLASLKKYINNGKPLNLY